ncbi:MAG: protein kinase domain-containing protein [Thermoanaerobaculia bacterium]
MGLKPGDTAGVYEILALIGAGGMGEVWRARDTRLGREVAIKILPDEFVENADRLARFEREARVLASFNHPRIASIFGLEQHEGRTLLVMELAPGDTLAQRIGRGPIAIREAMEIALQIAEALEAAHDKGIVHRDLKPANVKVSDDGEVKVLDFGIAKVFEQDEISGGNDDTKSPTVVKTASGAGVIMGTAAYMAPEQARGKKVDRRADVWAFGATLWEMLTRKRLFSGETVTDTLAAVLREEADLSELPAEVPEPIRRLLRRCLVKDPKHRMRDIGDARLEIEDALRGGWVVSDPVKQRARSPIVTYFPWMLAAILAVVAAAALLRQAKPAREARGVVRFEIEHAVTADWVDIPMISPDGRRVAFQKDGALWVRQLDRIEAKRVSGGDGGKVPFWSPDSSTLAFVKGDRLWRSTLGDDQPRAISPLPSENPWIGGAWGVDDRIVLAKWRGGIYTVPAGGGELRTLLEAKEGEIDFHGVSFLPDGRTIVTAVHAAADNADKLLLIENGERRELYHLGSEGGASAAWSPSGHIVLSRFSGIDAAVSVWAIPFDLAKKQTTGDAFLVVEDGAHASLSSDGTMAYVSSVQAKATQLLWVSADGIPGAAIGQAMRNLSDPAVSPDGAMLAVSALEGEDNQDIWTLDAARGLRTRITFSKAEDRYPSWSPDGKLLGWSRRMRFDWLSPENGIWLRPTDGTTSEHRLTEGSHPSFAPDGKVVYGTRSLKGDDDLAVIGSDAAGNSTILQTPHRTFDPHVSPDGRFVAYESNESGTLEIFVSSYPETRGKWQITTGGGTEPRWARDGNALYYTRENELWRIPISRAAGVSIGAPERVFSGAAIEATLERGYDLAPDGRFVVVRELDRDASALTIVQNWAEEFAAR